MLLDLKTFLVKERVAFAKLTDVYDIVDPSSGAQVGIAKEEPAAWAKWLRLILGKMLLPTTVNIYESESAPPVITLRRGVSLIQPRVDVNVSGRSAGYFQAKAFSLGGAFRIFDATGQEVGLVKGDWKGWNFQMLDANGQELGRVTKKWAGVGKELFTSADNYVIAIAESAWSRKDLAPLLLAAGISIDIVFKERK